MGKKTPDPSLPVWRCADEDICQETWAQRETPNQCPSCGGPAVSAGFTLAQVATWKDRLANPIYVPQPPPSSFGALVQLSQVSRDWWIGLPVFHPFAQTGADANWHRYDVGVVFAAYDDPVLGVCRVRFVMCNGAMLMYTADACWVPRALVDRLSRPATPRKSKAALKGTTRLGDQEIQTWLAKLSPRFRIRVALR